MSSHFYLNWAIMAISLFNALLLTWLGLTVLLNSDRRAWGIWVASTGLLLGAVFYTSHSAIQGLFISGYIVTNYNTIISHGLLSIGWNMAFWWTVGLVPAIALPFAWYVIILWYGGFWNGRQSSLFQRQRYWFGFTVVLLFLGLVGLAVGVVLLAVPAASLVGLRLFIRWSIAGIPLLAIGYSGYVILCFSLSLDALRQPGPSRRIMGTLARRRARPWLIAASIDLLLVSLLLTGILLWIVNDTRRRSFLEIYLSATEAIAWLDLLISVLICIAILLLGQAVVSYEVFTGKSLPRRGLLRHWRLAILLSAGVAILVSGTLSIQLRPLYSLVLVAMLTAGFYAVVSWRSYVERERYFEQLRPFVSSQRLLDQLLAPTAPETVDADTPFRALCANVLDAQVAFLVAVGPLAPLAGPALTYPENDQVLPSFSNLIGRFHSPQTAVIPLQPDHYAGAIWAIPLWSERGLIGLFLLGKKAGGGLYTQEEIEIARVSGERLIDTQASAEMARRLLVLQRERLAQSQIIDQQARRVLHDDILPSLQAAMIALNAEESHLDGQSAEALTFMTEAHKQISDLLHNMPTTTVPEVARLGLLRTLQRTVDNELAHAFDGINWEIETGAAERAESIPTLTAEVVYYAAREVIRNAARHGRVSAGERPFCLTISLSWPEGLLLQIEDNGVGFNGRGGPEARRGEGLALHSTMMAVVGGAITMDTVPGQFTRVSLTLPPQ